jgi:hypothetical protein
MNVFLWETCQMSEEGQVAVATWVTYRYKVATGKFRMKANELRLNRLQSNAVPLRHAGSKGERIYSSYSFLTSTLDGVSCQCHFPAALYPRGKDPCTHWIGAWVGLGAGVDIQARERNLCLCRGSNTGRPFCNQSLH